MIFDIPNVKETSNSEDELRLLVAELSGEEKKTYYKELEDKLKDPDTFAVLSYFLFFGLQSLYVGRYKLFFAETIGMILCWFMIYSDYAIAVITGGLAFFGLIGSRLFQLFFSQRIIADINYKASLACYKRIITSRKGT